MAVGTWEDVVLARKQSQKGLVRWLTRRKATNVEEAIENERAARQLEEVKHDVSKLLLHNGFQSLGGL